MSLVPHEHEQIAQIAAWQEELQALHTRISPHFRRPEARPGLGATWRDYSLRWSGVTAGS